MRQKAGRFPAVTASLPAPRFVNTIDTQRLLYLSRDSARNSDLAFEVPEQAV